MEALPWRRPARRRLATREAPSGDKLMAAAALRLHLVCPCRGKLRAAAEPKSSPHQHEDPFTPPPIPPPPSPPPYLIHHPFLKLLPAESRLHRHNQNHIHCSSGSHRLQSLIKRPVQPQPPHAAMCAHLTPRRRRLRRRASAASRPRPRACLQRG
jgi:hypothetical protein